MAEVVANGAEVAMDLYNRIPGSNEINVLLGDISKGDSQVSMWQYDMGSTAIDDFSGGVIVPILNTTGFGAHIKVTNLNVNADWNQTDSTLYSFISNKPSFATVATTGAYSDLTGKPTIPSNTNQLTNGAGFISSVPAQSFSSLTSKPTTLSGYGITDAYPLSSNPAGYLTSISAQSFSSLTGKPTTLAGYGITDPIVLTSGSYSNPTWITALDNSKITGLGSAALTASSAYATAAQGLLAASALQPTGSAASLTSFPTLNQNTTGNAATSTKLATARTINGISFDGTGNITITDSTKLTIPTGTTSQVVLGNGTLGTLPVVPTPSYSAYAGIITQSGSSNPTVTQVQNDFTGTTFTWARTGAGVYTVTASAATFTSGKTVVIQSDPQSVLVNYTAIINSTTVITVTTSTLAILLTLLGATATDGLMTNTLAEIRVYH